MSKLKKTLEPKYLVSFIIKFSTIVLLGFGIFGLFIIIFLNRKIGPTYLEGISSLSQLQGYLPSLILITVSVQALVLCLIALLLTLVWAHSLAGPLVRFRKFLRDTSLGKILKEPLVFRGADQLQGLAQAFSEMIMAQRNDDAKALARMVEAQKVLDQGETIEKQEKDKTVEFDNKLKELEKIYQEIKDIYRV